MTDLINEFIQDLFSLEYPNTLLSKNINIYKLLVKWGQKKDDKHE